MKFLKFSDGTEAEVIREDNRFFVTKDAQFRKSLYADCVIEKEAEEEPEKPAKKAKKKEEKADEKE